MTKEPSIFTKIINREVPATIHYEDDEFIVIDDISPAAPVHVMIIPKHPYETLEKVDENNTDFYGKMIALARKMAKKLDIAENYKLFMNVGKKVQYVHHIHLHLTGGWDKEKPRKEIKKETENSNSKYKKPHKQTDMRV